MKVLEVREARGDGPAMVLHDQVTVVRGLDPVRRSWLIDVLGRLCDGIEPDATGQIVAHGLSFPLDRESLALLDLESPVPSVVAAKDLPGHDQRLAEAIAARDRALVRRRELTSQITSEREALGEAVEARTEATEAIAELERGEGAARAAVAASDAAHSRLEADLASATEEVERHRAALAAAVADRDEAAEARATLEGRLERARQRHQTAMAEASNAAASLEQARPVADDDPTESLVEARAELQRAEAAAGEADPDDASAPVSRRLAALERRRVELNRLREAIGADDSDAVSEALATYTDAESEPTQVVAALAMADTWRDLHQQIQALDAGVSEEELAAEQRVAQARQSVIEAEIDFNQPVLTPEQITKVEAVHSAVLEAQDRAEGRFGSGRVRKKLDEARNEERRVLERLGFSTYADYMMSSSSRGVGPANRALLDVARTRLAEAEAMLRALPGAEDRARRRSELLQRREAVAPRVAALLGHEPTGPEAEDELRALREPDTAGQLAVDELAVSLSAAGIVVGEPPHEAEDVVLLARVYLAEQANAQERRRELSEAHEALDAEVTALRSARDRGERELPDRPALPPLAEPTAADVAAGSGAADEAQTLREARWAEVAAARTLVSEKEQAVARHREAADALTDLSQQLERCRTEEREAAAAVAEAEAELETASAASTGEGPGDAVAEAEAGLARATERQRLAQSALDAHSRDDAVAGLVAAATEALEAAERQVTEAAAAEQTTAASLAEVDAAFADATATTERAAAEAAELDRAALVDDIDWELMSRLARLRSVGLAGSIPLVLDDPFAVLDDDEIAQVLDRVGRLSEAVQVVVVSDREAAADWAAQAGPTRASVLGA